MHTATKTSSSYIRCGGICGQLVPDHVTTETCRYCRTVQSARHDDCVVKPDFKTKSNPMKLCSGICKQFVPGHVTEDSCRYCKKLSIQNAKISKRSIPTARSKPESKFKPQPKKICSGFCGCLVPRHVTPETCSQCAKWRICPGVCGKPVKRADWRNSCTGCLDIEHPIGICRNGCTGRRLYDSYCKSCSEQNRISKCISDNGGYVDGFSVVVVSTTPRSGGSYASYHINEGNPYIDVQIYRFDCLYSVLVKKDKLRKYMFSKIEVDHPDNYYCSGTDDFTFESSVYKYVISNALYDKLVRYDPYRVISALNSYSDYEWPDYSFESSSSESESSSSESESSSSDSDAEFDRDAYLAEFDWDAFHASIVARKAKTDKKKRDDVIERLKDIDVIWSDCKKIVVGDKAIFMRFNDKAGVFLDDFAR